MSQPLVSAIMITGKNPVRRPFALAAIKSFQLQTHTPRELVIINEGEQLVGGDTNNGEYYYQELPGSATVREIMYGTKLTLGELRNEGLEAARGEFICQWDDDDWSAPDRIAKQLAASHKGSAVTLSHQVRYSFVSKSAFAHRGQPQKDGRWLGIVGTVLHPRTEIRYKPQRKHEDSHFLQRWKRVTVLDNIHEPHLYLRFSHLYNTWDEKHIMGAMATRKNSVNLSRESAAYLRHVLAMEYGNVQAS
jgi:glycosyltransferase involved in cell wall biosynthesis